jgi:endoribonuclease Dicer
VLGDIVESFAGALVIDTGFDLDCVWKLMLNILQPIVTPETLCLQPVRELSEVCQHHNLTLDYVKASKGNGNGYLVEAKVSGKKVSGSVGGTGTRTSIKDAKKVASKDALLKLKVLILILLWLDYDNFNKVNDHFFPW